MSTLNIIQLIVNLKYYTNIIEMDMHNPHILSFKKMNQSQSISSTYSINSSCIKKSSKSQRGQIS